MDLIGCIFFLLLNAVVSFVPTLAANNGRYATLFILVLVILLNCGENTQNITLYIYFLYTKIGSKKHLELFINQS